MLKQEKSTWYISGNVGYYNGTSISDTKYVKVAGDTLIYFQGV